MVTTRTTRAPSCAALACLALTLPAQAATQVLYDPAFTPTNPALTGWLDGSLVGASASFGSRGVSITPAGNMSLAGYSNYPALLVVDPALPPVNASFPALDGSIGYRLSFGMDLGSEDHSGNSNRAGFSVTLIGQDKQGVEIGFQNDRIFAQSLVGNAFVAGASTVDAAFVSAAFAAHRWELTVLGGNYTLALGGQAVLSGTVHDYSAYAGSGRNAYNTPNFIFLGDNTTSAGASFLLSYAAITTGVPEASTGAMALGGLALLGLVRSRVRRSLKSGTG